MKVTLNYTNKGLIHAIRTQLEQQKKEGKITGDTSYKSIATCDFWKTIKDINDKHSAKNKVFHGKGFSCGDNSQNTDWTKTIVVYGSTTFEDEEWEALLKAMGLQLVKKEEPKAEVKEQPKVDAPEQPKTEMQELLKAEAHEEPKVEVQEQPKVEVPEEPKVEVQEEPKVEVQEQPEVEVQEQPKVEEHVAEPVKEEKPAPTEENKKEFAMPIMTMATLMKTLEDSGYENLISATEAIQTKLNCKVVLTPESELKIYNADGKELTQKDENGKTIFSDELRQSLDAQLLKDASQKVAADTIPETVEKTEAETNIEEPDDENCTDEEE